MKGRERAGSFGHHGVGAALAHGPWPQRGWGEGVWIGMWLSKESGEPAKPIIKHKGIWRQNVTAGLLTMKKLCEVLVEVHGTPWVCSSPLDVWNRRTWGHRFHMAFAIK